MENETINPTTIRFARTMEEAFPYDRFQHLSLPNDDTHLWQLAMAFCVGVCWGLLLGLWSKT